MAILKWLIVLLAHTLLTHAQAFKHGMIGEYGDRPYSLAVNKKNGAIAVGLEYKGLELLSNFKWLQPTEHQTLHQSTRVLCLLGLMLPSWEMLIFHLSTKKKGMATVVVTDLPLS